MARNVMGFKGIGLLAIIILVSGWMFWLYPRSMQKKYGSDPAVAAMKITAVPVETVADGVYDGQFQKNHIDVEVQVVVASHRIEDVVILKGGITKQGKKAELIAERILETNRNNVDVISGATVTGKALLKAVERALEQGTSNSGNEI